MKKLLSMTLVSVMSLSLLASCSSTETNTGSSSTGSTGSSSSGSSGTTTSSDINAGVFYYNYSDIYISTVRTNMDSLLNGAGFKFQNYDGNGNQATQIDQINTAIANGVNLLIVNAVDIAATEITNMASNAGIPIIYFNREVDDNCITDYANAAYVGTSSTEAGHLQGAMIGDYLLENYDDVDLNGDGVITYVMFKGQEGNVEADGRTRYSVEDADILLDEAGKPALQFYDANNSSKYLVDQGGNWSAQAASDYMNTILAEYSEANNNMIELVIANNDGMAEGAISSLQTVGFNTGSGKTVPIFGVDATDSAKQLISEGKMTGTIMQDPVAMSETIFGLVENVKNGDALMSNTDDLIVDEGVDKIRVPYSIYSGE